MNLFVIAVLVLIFIFLGSAVIGLLKGGKAGSDRMFKALRMRIILSVLLFAFLLLAGALGWIEPNGKPTSTIVKPTEPRLEANPRACPKIRTKLHAVLATSWNPKQ